jgi:hypothetical protein
MTRTTTAADSVDGDSGLDGHDDKEPQKQQQPRQQGPTTKIIIVLRNPIDRAYSHYDMKIRTRNLTFDELVQEEVTNLRTIGLSTAPTIQQYRTIRFNNKKNVNKRNSNNGTVSNEDSFDSSSTYSFDVPNQLYNNNNDTTSTTSSTISIKERRKKQKRHYRTMFANNYLQRGMYSDQLELWFESFASTSSSSSSVLLIIQYEYFQKHPHYTYQRILDFVGVSSHTEYRDIIPIDNFTTKYNPRSKDQPKMNKFTREYLTHFFQPYNERLKHLLKSYGYDGSTSKHNGHGVEIVGGMDDGKDWWK